MERKLVWPVLVSVLSLILVPHAGAFEGQIQADLTRGGQTIALQYSASPHCLRVENTATNWPYPVDLVDTDTGALTLLFPNNRTWVHLPSAPDTVPASGPASSIVPLSGALPAPPVSFPVAQTRPGSTPFAMPAPQVALTPPPASPAMSMPLSPAPGGMPMMPLDKLELKATGQITNLLGYACAGYELKQGGATMTIWVTDTLPPFQGWVQNQPAHFGQRQIEDQWAELVKARKLFPLLAILKLDHGPERYRFEVKTITPKKFTDTDAALFQVPADYQEIQPLPF